MRRPPVYVLLVSLVVIGGIAVRLALVPDADDIFQGHNDSKQYFAKAYGEFLHEMYYPLAHGASGWPLLLSGALRMFGFVGTAGFSMSMDAPWDEEGREATLFAYSFHAMVSATLVLATILLARSLVGPLTSLVAGALVAIDPFLLDQSTTVMADQIFAVMIILAIACVVKAKDSPVWLFVAGALVAVSHLMRVNGLLMLGAIVIFAAIHLRRAAPRHRLWHLAIPVVAFLLVAAPYLAWRAEHLPGAFDYGTNQRFWADDPWNMQDPYWKSYSYENGGERETAADYFATHSLSESALRFYQSGQWQLLDLTRVVLTPMLLVLGLAGMASTRRENWASITPIVGLTLAATFMWVYPIVRSPRYFLILVPLFAILASAGAVHAARATQRVTLGAVAILAPYFVTYAVEPFLRIEKAWSVLADPYSGPMVIGLSAVFVSMAAIPILAPAALIEVRRALSSRLRSPATRE